MAEHSRPVVMGGGVRWAGLSGFSVCWMLLLGVMGTVSGVLVGPVRAEGAAESLANPASSLANPVLRETSQASGGVETPSVPVQASALTVPAELRSLEPLERALRLSHPDVLQRYYLVSAAVATARASGQFAALDDLLESRFSPLPNEPLAWLMALWWADNALFARRYEEAIRRYKQVLAWLESDEATVGRPIMLLEAPLSEWVMLQLVTAVGLSGDLQGAARLVDPGRAWSDLLRPAARTRGARLAARSGDRELEEAFKARAPLPVEAGSVPPRQGLPVVRVQSQVGFLAPWEAGRFQRAGQWDRSWARTLSLIVRLPFDPSLRACGIWHGGFYYNTGTHAEARTRGRDTYAIDFTAPRVQESVGGRGSYGLELRAVAAGVVGIVHYGTPTHHDLRGIRPLAENNRLTLYHLPEGLSTLDALVYRQVKTVRWSGRLPTRLMDVWDYSSSYHHLVGMERACEPWRGPWRRRKCLEAPAQVSPGQWVWSGALLGYQDSTGYAWGPHLHFQINVTCQQQDVRCPDPLRQRFTGVSVPMQLEGELLSSGSVGRCIRSSNLEQLGVDGNANGLADVLESVLETTIPPLSPDIPE